MIYEKQKLVTLGKIGAAYGVKGWVRMNSFTMNPVDIFNYENLIIQTRDKKNIVAKVEDWKTHGNSLICKLNVITSKEHAKEFNNLFVSVLEEWMPQLQIDEYYWKDLYGCQVFNIEGYNLGKVIKIMETGSNDVLILNAPLDDKYSLKERLVPFIIDDYVKQVNIPEKKIIVDWDPQF